ncbi:radical SAM/SPASM domain-containing protein [Pedobacter soli]|nr:radical SAM protein [Pedobacter soli]
MKNSQFNTSFFYNGKFVLYNSLNNNFILLEPIVYELYQAAAKENQIDEISKYHEELYDILLENEIIVKDEVDEVKKVIDLRQKIDMNEDHYHLTINPTMNCNFKCWYCYESHIKSSKLDNVNLMRITSLIHKETEKPIKSFTISWFGGEPLLYYAQNVLPIIKFTHERCKEKEIQFLCTFTTNGYLIDDEMIEDFKKYEVNGFQITLDGNEEEHNKVRYVHKNKGSYREILENVFKLCRNNIIVSLRINYTQEKLATVHDIYNDLQHLEASARAYLKVDFQRVWQAEDSKESREEVLGLMNKFSNDGFKVSAVISNVDYVRNSCYADKKNHATINYDGNVFKCTARDFDAKNREGLLNTNGEIEWNEKYYHRLDAKFKNKPCLSCRLLPICNGGCSQQALEHAKEYCMYDFDEDRKTEVVKNKFLLMLNNITVA